MTEASLCKKSYFGSYLRYRLGRMKSFLIVGIILNFLVLPLQGVAMIIRVNRLYSSTGVTNLTTMVYITIIGAFAAIVGVGFTMVCAVSSYGFFCRKESVDTLGVLAVTYRQRFWGDFLGGFIPSVGTFIPCAVVGLILTYAAQSKLDTFMVDDKFVDTMPFFIGLTLTLFFANLFVYLITTLSAACCGRSSSMIVFAVISFAAVSALGISLTKFVTLEAPGLDDTSVTAAQQLCMPAGLIFSPVLKATGMMIDEHNTKLIAQLSELKFAAYSVSGIVISVIAAVVILVFAYYAGKSRKQENVGRMFVKTGLFHVVTAMMSLAGFFITADILRNKHRSLIIPIGLGVSAVIAVIFEVIRRPHAKELPKSAMRWIVTAACGVGLMFLISGTGSFGMVNIPKEVKSMTLEFSDKNYIHYSVKLTDPAEIAEFTKSHNKSVNQNKTMLRRPDDSQFPSSFVARYTTANEKEEIRAYYPIEGVYEQYRTLLGDNLMSLAFFPKKSAEMLDGKITSAEADISDIFTKVPVPEDKLSEFAKTLKQDIIERYDPNAKSIGNVTIGLEESSVEYPIQSDYENTIRLIHGYNNSAEKNPDAVIMNISVTEYKEETFDENTIFRSQTSSLHLRIHERDMESPKVKELLELIEVRDSPYGFGSPNLEINILSASGKNYGISDPDKNEKRAVALITQIALESVE